MSRILIFCAVSLACRLLQPFLDSLPPFALTFYLLILYFKKPKHVGLPFKMPTSTLIVHDNMVTDRPLQTLWNGATEGLHDPRKLTHTEIGSLCSTLFSLSERHEERGPLYLNVNHEKFNFKVSLSTCPTVSWIGLGRVYILQHQREMTPDLSPLNIDSTDLGSYVNPENFATSYQVTVFTSFVECDLKSSGLKSPKYVYKENMLFKV